MTLDELQREVRARLAGDVFVRARQQDGKPIVEAGLEVPWTERRKGYTKSITFNAASIPENAVDKIERAIR